uniref:E3 ubiquitin-protein transferase MAEA n=1 Tax=Glossina austeni TaxID=7395 RepID=A0A1A9VEP2_GLOAU
MSEIKCLEHSTLKVPYEIINKKFRVAQKAIDREADQVQLASKEVEKALKVSVHPTISDISKLVGCVVQRIQVLKRKAEENIEDELNSSYVCKRKIEHLKGIAPPENNNEIWQASFDKWKRVRIDRMVVEHLLRMGYYKTAERLASQSNIQHLTNLAIEPYKSLFGMKRWTELVIKFRNENYRLFQLSTQSLLTVAIQAGLSALKTPQCYSITCKNLNCPVCQEDFNQIAKHLPYSHCVQSRLICR